MVGASPAAVQIGTPANRAHGGGLPNVAVVWRLEPRPVRSQRIIKRAVVGHREVHGGRAVSDGLRDGFAAGQFEFAAAEGLVALVHVLLLVFEGRLQPIEVAFALGECLLAGGEVFLLGCGVSVLGLFQRGAVVLDAAAFALDGIAFAGKLLVGELAFEVLFLCERLTVLAFQLGEFFFYSGVGLVATGERDDDPHGNGQQERVFHGDEGIRLIRRNPAADYSDEFSAPLKRNGKGASWGAVRATADFKFQISDIRFQISNFNFQIHRTPRVATSKSTRAGPWRPGRISRRVTRVPRSASNRRNSMVRACGNLAKIGCSG